MQINHLDLAVHDTASLAGFFQTYFGLSKIKQRENIILLTDEHGFILALSTLSQNDAELYPSGFHIGFNLTSEQQIESLYTDLCQCDVPIARPLALLNGHLTFQCLAPGGIIVEVGLHQVSANQSVVTAPHRFVNGELS